ncbi:MULTISPECIES: MerR family transcriptional regulator [Demequina]|uniref:MerR family transcriptional regulator n=1 Tax=Demequina TaxID=577469 RepID=UPI000785D47A|nr:MULTISPECIES: MerR family transcriptional regulator [Demequina]
MPVQTKRYSIREAVVISGLPASTLRYYETIGLIQPIARDASGHRTYSQQDLDVIEGVACLAATGMGIPEMREYIANFPEGAARADDEIALMLRQQQALEREAERVRRRQEYVALKLEYWAAIRRGDDAAAEGLTDEMRLAGTRMRAN